MTAGSQARVLSDFTSQWVGASSLPSSHPRVQLLTFKGFWESKVFWLQFFRAVRQYSWDSETTLDHLPARWCTPVFCRTTREDPSSSGLHRHSLCPLKGELPGVCYPDVKALLSSRGHWLSVIARELWGCSKEEGCCQAGEHLPFKSGSQQSQGECVSHWQQALFEGGMAYPVQPELQWWLGERVEEVLTVKPWPTTVQWRTPAETEL